MRNLATETSKYRYSAEVMLKLLMGMAAVVLISLAMRGTALAVASVTFQSSPSSTTCGSAQNITVTVLDTNGNPAPNNTPVTFSTSLGYITTTRVTDGNRAEASLVIPPKMSGTATVTATALSVSATKAITVTCPVVTAPIFVSPVQAPVLAQPPAVAAPAPQAPAQPAAPAGLSMNVSMTEFSYAPASFNVRVGQPVSLNVTNAGRLPHTLTIASVVDSGTVAGGGSRPVQFTPRQAGTLTYFCTIHGASVMSGRINVMP